MIDGMPLDRMLGGGANLGVLRAIAAHSWRLVWPTEIVEWSGLSRSGVWKALHRLEEVAIVEPVDTGHGRVYPFRYVSRNRLADPLIQLFWAEQEALRAGIEKRGRLQIGTLLDGGKHAAMPRLW